MIGVSGALALALAGLAGGLAAAVVHGRAASRRIESRWPPESPPVAHGPSGHRLHVRRRGDGPPVLLIHGASSNGLEWLTALGDRLHGLTLLAADRPGLGHSPGFETAWRLETQAALMAELLAAEDRGPAVVAGHSWGAAVALRLALDHPERVKGLLLSAPASHPWPGGTGWVNRIAAHPLAGRALSAVLPPLLGPRLAPAGIAKGFAPGPVRPADYGERIGTPLVFRPSAFRANARDMAAASAELAAQAPLYPRLDCLPAIILTGGGDRIVSNAIHARQLARALPGARAVRVPEAGHMPHWVAPDLAAGFIRALALSEPMPEIPPAFGAAG